jgi:hypothetical protein
MVLLLLHTLQDGRWAVYRLSFRRARKRLTEEAYPIWLRFWN